MTCFHPITAWQQTKAHLDIPAQDYYDLKKVSFYHSNGRLKIEIPCGNCLGCKLDHANMWATRIMVESKSWKKNCVIALTYNDKELHHNIKSGLNTLVKKDLQNFLKRLRYYHKGIETWKNPNNDKIENPIRYFACGEYGKTGTRKNNGGNPHFHAVLFNWIPDDLEFYKYNKYGDIVYKSKSLQKIWKHGFVTVEDLNYNTACYVARYVQKKAGIEPRKREYTGQLIPEPKIDERNGETFTHWRKEIKKPELDQEDEFITMSRGVGIGRTFWEQNKDKIKRNNGIWLKIKDKLKLKPIPRYFKKQWEKENWEEYHIWKYEISKKGEITKKEIIEQISLPDTFTDEQKYEFYLKTQEKLLKERARQKLKRNTIR